MDLFLLVVLIKKFELFYVPLKFQAVTYILQNNIKCSTLMLLNAIVINILK